MLSGLIDKARIGEARGANPTSGLVLVGGKVQSAALQLATIFWIADFS